MGEMNFKNEELLLQQLPLLNQGLTQSEYVRASDRPDKLDLSNIIKLANQSSANNADIIGKMSATTEA